MTGDLVYLLPDPEQNVWFLETEKEGEAKCFAHGPAASSEEVNERDHQLLVRVVRLGGLDSLGKKVVNITSELCFNQELTYLMKSPKSIFLKRQFLLYHKFHNVVLENIHMLLYSIVDKRKRRKVLEVWDPDLKVQIIIEYVLMIISYQVVPQSYSL